MYTHLIDSETLREVALPLCDGVWETGKTKQTQWAISKSLAQVITDSAKELDTSAGRLISTLTIQFLAGATPEKLVIPPHTPKNLSLAGREAVFVGWNVSPTLLAFYTRLFKKTKIKNVFFVEAVIVWAMNNQPKEEN